MKIALLRVLAKTSYQAFNRSFIILRSREGLNSFNKDNIANVFLANQKNHEAFRGVYFLITREKTFSQISSSNLKVSFIARVSLIIGISLFFFLDIHKTSFLSEKYYGKECGNCLNEVGKGVEKNISLKLLSSLIQEDFECFFVMQTEIVHHRRL